MEGPPTNPGKGYSPQESRRIFSEEMAWMGRFVLDWHSNELKQVPDEKVRREMRLYDLRKLVGGPGEGFGQMQERLNSLTDGILERLRQEFPKFRDIDLLVYSYYAAGFPNRLTQFLSGYKRENDVMVIRNRMRNHIIYSKSPNKEEYLEFLPQKGCRFD